MAAEDNGTPTEHAKGLWSWPARHAEWHPGDFGAEVISFAARGRGGVLLVLDPLLPDGPEREQVLALLDRQAGLKSTKAISIQISVGYHARSTEELWQRWRKGDVPLSVHGHAAVRKRLGKRVHKDFSEIEPGTELPGGVVPYAIGKPRRQETPLWIPSHSAILFGDAVVGAEGGARAWPDHPVDAKTEAFYRERFNPTLEPLLELGAERLLFTHGPSVFANGTRVLREGLAAGPWYHRG